MQELLAPTDPPVAPTDPPVAPGPAGPAAAAGAAAAAEEAQWRQVLRQVRRHLYAACCARLARQAALAPVAEVDLGDFFKGLTEAKRQDVGPEGRVESGVVSYEQILLRMLRTRWQKQGSHACRKQSDTISHAHVHTKLIQHTTTCKKHMQYGYEYRHDIKQIVHTYIYIYLYQDKYHFNFPAKGGQPLFKQRAFIAFSLPSLFFSKPGSSRATRPQEETGDAARPETGRRSAYSWWIATDVLEAGGGEMQRPEA